jgi:hypothetical protein
MTNAIDLSASANVQSALSAAGYSGQQLQDAVAGYTGINAAAQNEVLSAADAVASGGVNLASMTAVLSAGFAIAGLPMVGAAIAGAVPILESLANLLDNGDKHYDWYIGKVGITGVQPYGPHDPEWQHFDSWFANVAPGYEAMFPGDSDPLEDLIPGLSSIKEPSDWPVPKTPQDVFLAVYRQAWRTNAEMLINGHQWVSPYELLTATVTLWNSTHQPGARFTFDGSGTTYIDYLIRGLYASLGNPPYPPGRNPPVTINTGAAIAPAKAPVVTTKVVNLTPDSNPLTALPLQAAILTAVTGAKYVGAAQGGPAMTAAWTNLLTNGISQSQFNGLSSTLQNLVNSAGIPVGTDPVSIPTVAQGTLTGAAAAPASSNAGWVLFGLAGAAAAAAWAFFRGKKGEVLSP